MAYRSTRDLYNSNVLIRAPLKSGFQCGQNFRIFKTVQVTEVQLGLRTTRLDNYSEGGQCLTGMPFTVPTAGFLEEEAGVERSS